MFYRWVIYHLPTRANLHVAWFEHVFCHSKQLTKTDFRLNNHSIPSYMDVCNRYVVCGKRKNK